MKVVCSFPYQKQIKKTLKTLFGDAINFNNLTIQLVFAYPEFKFFNAYILEWDHRRKIIEGLFVDYDGENDKITIYLHSVIIVSQIMTHSYNIVLKFVLFYEMGTRIFREQVKDVKYRNTTIERFVSVMIAYHCIKSGKIEEELNDFFYDVLVILEDDYQRCKCFIRTKDGKNNPLSLQDVIKFIEYIGKGNLINDSNELMRYFDSYIDKRFTSWQETVTPYLMFLTEEQRKRWGHLDHNNGFFPE